MKKGLLALQNSGTGLSDVAEPGPYCPHCFQLALGFGSDEGNNGLDRQPAVPGLQLQWRGWVSERESGCHHCMGGSLFHIVDSLDRKCTP